MYLSLMSFLKMVSDYYFYIKPRHTGANVTKHLNYHRIYGSHEIIEYSMINKPCMPHRSIKLMGDMIAIPRHKSFHTRYLMRDVGSYNLRNKSLINWL